MLRFEKIINLPTPLTEIFDTLFEEKQLRVFVKRDDMTHPLISGNKFRKLKYNLIQANDAQQNKLLTFGGAYSNHIAATAEAAKLFGFKATGIIRGNELNNESSKTLKNASKAGMDLVFVSREEYKDKASLIKKYETTHFVIPEGGSNLLCILGVREMVDEILKINKEIDHICVAVGTGGTMAGILSNNDYDKKVVGVCVLKDGGFLKADVSSILGNVFPEKRAEILLDYHFGGYAKYTQNLLDFMEDFEGKQKIKLDHVYTAKLFYAIYDKIKSDYFEKGESIVIIHTGGLQGRLEI